MDQFTAQSVLAGIQAGESLSSIAASAKKGAGAVSPEQLKTLAAQFESVLLAQMLQGVKASMFEGDGEGKGGSAPLSDALFADLTAAISRARGLGLADQLLAPLMNQLGGGPEVVEKLRQAVQDRDFKALGSVLNVSEK